MDYRLNDDLSCCVVDDSLIFLDVARDRYFSLTGPLGEALRRLQAQESVDPTLINELIERGILTEVADPVPDPTPASIQLPARSAIEQDHDACERLSAAAVLEVSAFVWSTRRKLRTRSFKANLDEAIAYRERKTEPSKNEKSLPSEQSLLRAAWQFTQARRYVPIDPICLLDSLSMLRFLSRRALRAHIVFGVTAEPFAAHCWVQAGDIVLNETLSDAIAHTPIRRA
ncbi:MAG: lasso peptide biosynthesis B2 protein [Dyella sp.]|uniref:lasso peptide biosynthesis B2 protein n=1 Tax=Dyella sp. TaxID=1869338 RepID=UPI003F7F69FA